MKKWIVADRENTVLEIGEKFGIGPVFSKILHNRNILTEEGMAVYLNPNIKYFRNTMEFKDIKKAFKYLSAAIYGSKKIVIYGDYDVDGVSSTVILYKGLKNLGAFVEYYIPDREREGYGLNMNAVERLKEMKADLIIACDNGIAAFEEIKELKRSKINVIVLDHHEPQFVSSNDESAEIIPKADAVIDAKQQKCPYPFKSLCAGGMSYKFIKAFYDFLNIKLENEAELFVFASLATVCDIVELVDENRILVRNGLKLINNRKNLNLGLTELIRIKGLDDKKITETSYGFIIGPCINASGRLDSALNAVKLFTTGDKEEAEKLAAEISALNDKRKFMTEQAAQRLIDKIESYDKIDKVLVLYDENIHESIVGIVAGRLREKYFRPVIVLTASSNEGIAKGSARSIEGYNIFEQLNRLSLLFERFGGHSMAAGLSIKRENIDDLRRKLNENCPLNEEDMIEVLNIDMELPIGNVNLELAYNLDLMRPIGKENPPPLFLCRNLWIKRINFVGASGRYIQLTLCDEKGYSLKAVDFRNYDYFVEGLKKSVDEQEYELIINGKKKDVYINVDLVYEIDINEYNGVKSVQLKAVDYRFNI